MTPNAHQAEFRLSLTVKPEGLHRIRRMVFAHLRLWRSTELSDDALKIVTELLSNVHKHAGGRAVLLLQVTRESLRITVSDRSEKMPVVREPDWQATSGRGMLLISALSDEWRAVRTPTGKDVYVILVISRYRKDLMRGELVG
ncbi:ATP-binding protein [Streptomyces sp. NPDC018584]|uniref:ATP-binding protein n=1 Tax=unclassified Streptomyces TaxID=2593676 RepID=UPI0037A6B8BF